MLVFLDISMLCAIIVLSALCYNLKQEREKVARESIYHFNLWRGAWSEWTKERERLEIAHAGLKLWRDKWKAGAFEMDAATMAGLADEECSMSGNALHSKSDKNDYDQ